MNKRSLRKHCLRWHAHEKRYFFCKILIDKPDFEARLSRCKNTRPTKWGYIVQENIRYVNHFINEVISYWIKFKIKSFLSSK